MIYILNEVLEVLLRKYDISDERFLEFWRNLYMIIFFKRFLKSKEKNYNSCSFIIYFINQFIIGFL